MRYLRAMPLLLVLGALVSSFSLACGGGGHHDHVVHEKEVIIEHPHH